MINHGLYTDTAWSVSVLFYDANGAALALAGQFVCDIYSGSTLVFSFKSTGGGATDGVIGTTAAASGELDFTASTTQHANVRAGVYRAHLKADLADDSWQATGKMVVGKPGARETYILFDTFENTSATASLTIPVLAHTHTAVQISDSTAAGRALLTAADAAAQRAAMDVRTQVTLVSVGDQTGYDPTGVTDQVAPFQAAVDATPNAGLQRIHVPRGTYKGDLSTLDYGLRQIVWVEEAGIAYPDQYPSATRGEMRSLPPLLFSGNIDPARHLKQFSLRKSTSGKGFIAGTVTFALGAITAIAVTAGGSNYGTTARVLITGDGTGAAATVTLAGGAISAITVTAGGTGYTVATVYVVDGPVVVLAGDSISMPHPVSSIEGENQWTLIRKALREQNPGRSMTFFNRAVGGHTWTAFNSLPVSSWPDWYVNQAKAWIDYVSELQPDLVILSFGMNDRDNFIIAQYTAAMAKLRNFTTAPDIVLCTPLVPSAISTNPNISDPVPQIGRDMVAGYLRGMALSNSYGLLDFNRQLRLVRDGIDVRHSTLRLETTTASAALPWTATQTCADFYVRPTFAAVAADFWTGRTIDVTLSPAGPNSASLVRIDSNGGFVRVTVVDLDVASTTYVTQVTSTSTVAAPASGDIALAVTMLDQTLEVTLNDALVFHQTIGRLGGTFSPSVSSNLAASATIKFAWGKYVQYPPRLTDYELWGYGPEAVYGGNGLNHPTSFGVKHVFAPVVQNADWRASSVMYGTLSQQMNFTGFGEPNPNALLHLTGTKAAVTLIPPVTGNMLKIEDAANAGLAIMTPATGTCRVIFGDEGNASQCALTYNHASDVFSFVINGVNQMQVASAGGVKIGSAAAFKGVNTLNVGTEYYRNGIVLATSFGYSLMAAADAATAVTNLGITAATQSVDGLMAAADKKKLDSRPYASLFDVIPAAEWAAIRAGASTLDVSSYVQAAIDAGVTIVATEGEYILGSAIKLKTGTSIRAMGAPGKVVFKASSAMTAPVMIDVNSLSGGTGIYAQSNILLDGLTIDGNNRTLGSDAFLMRLYSVDGLTLRNLTVRNNQWGLAGIGGCRDVSLSGLRFRNWGRPAVSGEGGAALWLAGNGSVGDDTATSRVRGTDLDFADAEWCACYDFSTDSVFANVIIKDVKEGAFYCQNTQSGTASADNEALRHLYVNFNIKGVRRKYISAAGFEIAAPNSAIVNCNITDTDDTGIKVYWKNSSITISGCNIWDVVKQQASQPTYTNYGHIQLIQSNTVDDADITIVNNRLGSADVAPTAKYAIGISNLNGAGHYFTGLNIQGNNLVNGFTTAAFNQANTPVAATDVTSAICNNIGADDLFNPSKVKRENMLGGSDLVNAVENGRFEKGSIGWTFDASLWAISNDPTNARSGNWVAVNSDTSGLQKTFDSNYSAVEAGETVYAEAWLKTGASLTATNVRVVINWYDKDKVYLSAANGTNYTTPQVAYVLSAVSGPAPATACYFTVKVLAQKTVGTVYVDNVTAYRSRDAAKLLADASVTTPKISNTLPMVMKNYTVATLPAAASYTYGRAFVSDANATMTAGIGAIVAGGGANSVPVFSDGTNWRIG